MIRLLRWGLGTSVLAIGLIASLLSWNLWSYHRLTHEQWVADLHFTRVADGRFVATINQPDASRRELELRGDDWQLDARLITWQPWLQLLGNDPLYRLDSLSGRYRDIDQARQQTPSVYALGDNGGLDLWSLMREGGHWLPGVDAAYGSAVFLPMEHDASYRVTLSANGLVARPTNNPARSAVSSWY
jgi:hypothetical protein